MSSEPEGMAGASEGIPQPDQGQRRFAALAYFWLTGLIFLFLPRFRDDRFVRFHSLQAFFYGLAAFVLNATFGTFQLAIDPMSSLMLVYLTVWGLVRLALVLVWLLVLLKAYVGVEYKLPWLGDLASKYS